MVSTLLTRSTYACVSCRRQLLNSFAALAGLQPSWSVARTSRAPSNPQLRQHRPFTRTAIRNESEPTTQRAPAVLPGVAGLEEVEAGPIQQSVNALDDTKDEDLPWYLRQQYEEQPLRQLPQHLTDRQKIPDLPDLPPPLLQTLLEHISVDLGLDDMSLLDLRSLDPPSALGANLIMVVGTARSEKHLHVSADRFCRHLRATHKLRAHADGLLGRGELKIRMRRMAKRSRILASVGAMDTRRLHDDIRTGWVCVMVDGIEPHPDWVGPKQSPDFVGFDERSDKVNLVVQMFTEAKREEIGLETLWTRRSERAAKEQAPEEDTSSGEPLSAGSLHDAPQSIRSELPRESITG